LIFTAAHLSAIGASGELVAQLTEFYYGDERFERFHGPKPKFVKATYEYLEAPLAKWYSLFANHIEIMDLPHHEFRAQLHHAKPKTIVGNYMNIRLRHVPHTGKLSCFRRGISTCLPRSMASPRAIRRRVECGMITSSM
jgi:hypothetical protein